MRQARRWSSLAPWAVVGMLLLAFALRTYQLGVRELGFDEVASVFIAGHGPLKLFSYLRGAIREHPPFYYLLLSLWMPLTGRSEFAVRFLSVGVGLITIAAMIAICCDSDLLSYSSTAHDRTAYRHRRGHFRFRTSICSVA